MPHRQRPRARSGRTRPLGVLILALVWLVAAAGPQAAAAKTTLRRSEVKPGSALPILLPLDADAPGLAAFATAVSTPGSAEFGRYLPIDALAQRFGASPSARARVVSFLRDAGAWRVHVDRTGLFVTAELRAGTAERLFSTPLVEVHGPRAPAYTTPAATVHLPGALRGIVTGVVGLDTRPLALDPTLEPRHPVRSDAVSGSGYSGPNGSPKGCRSGLDVHGFAPNEYAHAYGFSSLASAGLEGQGERVALIEIDGFRTGDVKAFARCFGLHVPAIDVFGVGGVNRPLTPSGEATLDLEVVSAAAQRLRSIDVYETRNSATSVLEGLTAPLQNPGYVPQVISASLGLCERQIEENIGRGGLDAAEESLEEAAATGVSVLAASGDNGSSDCLDAYGAPIRRLDVNYPASSPWVTAVGGTNVTLTAANVIASQTVWHDGPAFGGGAGGGGTSVYFARPSYQDGTVTSANRTLPDVALLSDVQPGYDIYCTAKYDRSNPDGCVSAEYRNPWQPFGGTSAATPLMAAGVALVDQDLRRHGQVAVGFANPLLYGLGRSAAAGDVFDDVTSGNDDVTEIGCCSATLGFDAASGFGGVDMPGLASAALALEPKIPQIALALPAGQRPIAAKRIVSTITCSAACDAGIYARVYVSRKRVFTVYSHVAVLKAAGSATVTMRFTRGQESRLRSDLRHHDHVTAYVRAAVVDGGGNIERETGARTLTLRS